MLVEVKVPQLSESVSEATLLTWHKQPGEYVSRDENLIDIETDKVVLELPAPDSGVLVSVLKRDGGTVTSQEVIATIDTDATDGESAVRPAAPPTAAAVPAAAPRAAAAPPMMPAAQKLAAENRVVVSEVTGTGRGGRVTKGDVLDAVESRGRPQAPSTATTATPLARVAAPVDVDTLLADRPEQRVPMTRLRARVAERLLQSQATTATLTTFNEVNMQPVTELRARHRDRFEKEHGVRLGFMSFFLKATVYALKKFPAVNASIDGNDIVYHGYFDIGVAVASPRGLVVPIVRDADRKSMADLEREVADYGKRASAGKLAIEELTGGTFSISNGGVFGSMLSTPIINPPQSAILGVHATRDRPVVENGQIVIRPMNYLALSYDHRIIDGREAVLTLVAIKEAIEDPARLLLEV